MSYVLVSESEVLIFTELGTDVQAVGRTHAVDLSFPPNRAGGVLAYAVCGAPVRMWPDQVFDPDAAGAHPQCAGSGRA